MNESESARHEEWQNLAAKFEELIRQTGWEYLKPMPDLVRWASAQPFADRLYAFTSHEWLCVSIIPSAEPTPHFFTCGIRPDGQVAFSRNNLAVTQDDATTCDIDEARVEFARFAAAMIDTLEES